MMNYECVSCYWQIFTLQVRLEEVLSNRFKTTIGTPQGDGLFAILLTIYLERALKDASPTEIHRRQKHP